MEVAAGRGQQVVADDYMVAIALGCSSGQSGTLPPETPRRIIAVREAREQAKKAICCWFFECCCCCGRLPKPVRNLIALTITEAVSAFCYAIYIVAIVVAEDVRGREELFGAGFLTVLGTALLVLQHSVHNGHGRGVQRKRGGLQRDRWAHTRSSGGHYI